MVGNAACTAWIKFKQSTHLAKNITLQYIEIAGNQTGGICIDWNDHENAHVDKYPNGWIQDMTVRYCYLHGAGGMYLGSNYLPSGAVYLDVPVRRTTVEYCRVIDTSQECCTLKKHWEGPNFIRHNWFENSGRTTTSNPPQREITMLYSSTATICGNFYFFSGRGLADLAQADEHGIAVASFQGPDQSGVPFGGTGVPASSYSSYGPYPYFEIEIYNNVIVDSAKDGIHTRVGSADTAHGVQTLPRLLTKVYNNTICQNQKYGIDFADQPLAGSFCRNNIVLGNESGQLQGFAATLGNGLNKTSGDEVTGLFVDPTATAYANRDYHLTKRVPTATGSTLGVNIAATDIEGSTRELDSADMGAYERP
jgi:hypothetical protein